MAAASALAAGVAAIWSPATRTAATGATAHSGPAVPVATAAAPDAAAPSPRTPVPSPRSTLTPRAPTRAELARSLDRSLADRPGQFSLSIRDLSTGFTLTYHPQVRAATASIAKVDILIALLLRAQKADRRLSTAEEALAAQMIEVSDNKAADTLWNTIDRSTGLAAANRRLGLRSTNPDPGVFWGSTTTSAADQVRILTALASSRSPLTGQNRRYVLDLMEHVTPEQAWGVSAAAATGDTVALKNGWLPRSSDAGRWTINSIGRVRGAGHDYLIAVLSTQNNSMTSGIETVEHATNLVTSALTRQ
jgi:beta-lactamase class A